VCVADKRKAMQLHMKGQRWAGKGLNLDQLQKRVSDGQQNKMTKIVED